MRIEGSPRISRPIPLTPLVDVVFLLLMFFMLSTTFARHGQLGTGENREAAAAPAAVAAANTPPGLVIDVGHGPAVSINGSAVAIADLVARLKTLHQRGVTSGIIRARRDADVQDLVSVMELVRTSGLPSMTLSGR